MFRRLTILILAVSPGLALAVSKEIQELQRDVAQLQDMVRSLQRSQDEKFSALQVMVQQSVNTANDANRSVAVIQSGLQQNLRDQTEKVVTPVVGLNTRMTQMSDDLRTVTQAVSDLASQISKIQSQLADLNNAVKVLQAPPPPPPTTTTDAGGAGGAPPGGNPNIPTMSMSALYDSARRDYLGGKNDLAVQEFSEFLKWYGSTELAPNAQFYIAAIHYAQGDFDSAVKEYDIVLEKYPDNNKTPDAMFGKGQALVKMGRRTDGAREFQELVKRFPKHDLASQACTQLKALGYATCGARVAPPKGAATKKRKQ